MGDGRRWLLAAGIFLTATVLFVVGFLFRERIQRLLERMGRRVSRRKPGRGRAAKGKDSP